MAKGHSHKHGNGHAHAPVVRGGPYYTRPQGVYVRSGFRNSNSIINMGRAGTDQTNIWESWIQTGAQF